MDAYLLNCAKFVKTVSSTQRNPITIPITNKYLIKKHPSLIAIDNLLLKSIKISITPKRINKAKESLNTTDCPMHPRLN